MLAAALSAILDLHRPDFPTAQRPIAPPPPTLNEQDFFTRHRKVALAGIGISPGRHAGKPRQPRTTPPAPSWLLSARTTSACTVSIRKSSTCCGIGCWTTTRRSS